MNDTLIICITALIGLVILGCIVLAVMDKAIAHGDKIYGRK